MPYIKQEDRQALRPTAPDVARSAGELNYQFTMLARDYIENNGLCYQSINDVLGALDGASKEFYRRVAAPYEDTMIHANGDVH